jgi:hypothetical protein
MMASPLEHYAVGARPRFGRGVFFERLLSLQNDLGSAPKEYEPTGSPVDEASRRAVYDGLLRRRRRRAGDFAGAIAAGRA